MSIYPANKEGYNGHSKSNIGTYEILKRFVWNNWANYNLT